MLWEPPTPTVNTLPPPYSHTLPPTPSPQPLKASADSQVSSFRTAELPSNSHLPKTETNLTLPVLLPFSIFHSGTSTLLVELVLNAQDSPSTLTVSVLHHALLTHSTTEVPASLARMVKPGMVMPVSTDASTVKYGTSMLAAVPAHQAATGMEAAV